MSASLANRATIREIVQTYMEAEETVRRSFAAVLDAQRELDAVLLIDPKGFRRAIDIDSTAAICHHSSDWGDVDATLTKMRRQMWRAIVDRMQLRRMMSVAAWATLDKWLDKAPMPEVTEQSVETFVAKYERGLPAMIEAAVAEVYVWLRPANRMAGTAGEYKTNSLYEIGRHVIITGAVEKLAGVMWVVRGWQIQHFTAMENLFTALDGQGQFTKAHQGVLLDAISRSQGTGETGYFKFKCCNNGNMHITFARPDLLAKFNAMAGGKVLRPGPKAVAAEANRGH